MATPTPPVARLRGLAVLGLTLIGLTAALAACASGAPASRPAAATRPVSTAALRSTCKQVGAVLSDGPDPDADPVGYAEAQILPLRQLHTSDSVLRSAISQLASAYDEFFAHNGKSAEATSAVATATARMNKLCPGAAA